MPGCEERVLTGQLGDIMKEPARVALTWVRSHAARVGIDERNRGDLDDVPASDPLDAIWSRG
jgi:ATP-dependent Lon protease